MVFPEEHGKRQLDVGSDRRSIARKGADIAQEATAVTARGGQRVLQGEGREVEQTHPSPTAFVGLKDQRRPGEQAVRGEVEAHGEMVPLRKLKGSI